MAYKETVNQKQLRSYLRDFFLIFVALLIEYTLAELVLSHDSQKFNADFVYYYDGKNNEKLISQISIDIDSDEPLSASGIISRYLDDRTPQGHNFGCRLVLCQLFGNENKKKEYITHYILNNVIQVLYDCVLPSGFVRDGEYIKGGEGPRECYTRYLSWMIDTFDESRTSVYQINQRVDRFLGRLVRVRDQIERPRILRQTDKLLYNQFLLLNAAEGLAVYCETTEGSRPACAGSISSVDVGKMQENLSLASQSLRDGSGFTSESVASVLAKILVLSVTTLGYIILWHGIAMVYHTIRSRHPHVPL